jgi:putative GTP pyrophosphokinase
MSLHFVLELSKERLQLRENLAFKKLKFEVQLRSILQHGWAEIEHDLGYKGSGNLPKPAKRNFHRIAALLETADLEFIRLKETLSSYENKISSQIISSPELIDINQASLRVAIEKNEDLIALENEIVKILNIPVLDEYIKLEDIASFVKDRGISTIKQLVDNILEDRAKIINHAKARAQVVIEQSIKNVLKGISLYYFTEVNSTKNVI